MYCGECGHKNDGGKFCSNCGTPYKIKNEKIVFTKFIKVISNKFVIASIIIVMLLVGFYYVGSKMFSPLNVANEYMDALVNEDIDKVYEIYGIEESAFTSKDTFKEKYSEEGNFTYELDNIEMVDKTAIITYKIYEDGKYETSSLVKLYQDGKKFLIFDNWKIEIKKESFIKEDFEIEFKEGSIIEVDGFKLDSSYLKEGTNNIYLIEELFIDSYDIKITYPFGIVIDDSFSTFSYNYDATTFNLYDVDDSVLENIEKVTLNELNTLYSNMIEKKEFDSIKGMYPFANDEFEDDYKELYNDIIEGVYPLTKINFDDIKITEINVEENELQVVARVSYDYEITYVDLMGEEQQVSLSRNYISQSIYLKYENGEYVFSGIDDVTNYFSRY